MCLIIPLHAIVVGSNTVVSQQAFMVFPAIDTNNEILGFAQMGNGFRLENSSTSCKYNSFQPIFGHIVLNGGLLWLAEDLVCQDYVDFPTIGAIGGNGYAMRFTTTSCFLFPSGQESGQLLQSVASANVTAAVNAVDWTSNGSFLAVGASTQFRIFSFDETPTFSQRYATTFATSVNDIAWRPHSSFLATGRALGSNELQLWYFDTSAYTLTLTDSKSFAKAVYALAWRPDGNYLAVATTRGSQDVLIYSFDATTSRLTEVAGYDFTQSVSVSLRALSWDSTGSYLAVGLPSTTSADLAVLYFNGSTLTLNAQAEVGATVSAVSYCPTASLISVGLGSGSSRLRLYTHNPTAGTLTEQTTARFTESSIVYSVNWNSTGTQIVLGRATSTTGGELRVYDVQTVGTYLYYLVAELNSPVTISSARWRFDDIFIGSGGIITNNVQIFRCRQEDLSGGFLFGNVKLSLGSDVILNNTITFTGSCCIDGAGSTISFSENGGMVVGTGASLLLRNLTIDTVAGTNIRCLDAASTLSLAHVVFNLDSDWTFTQGHFDIIGDVHCTGTRALVYRTTQTTTIYDNATWFFDAGATFSYAPDNGAINLISFAASSASLYFSGATLCVPATGLQLLGGKLTLDGDCVLINNAIDGSGGLILGDGIAEQNNVAIEILPGSGLICQHGFLVNNNI